MDKGNFLKFTYMKKAFSVFLSFCLCTITMLGFTACGDDEHEDKHEHGAKDGSS
ncbi:hypothetical protein DN0286_38570 [Parabacteroides distasonis]|nr:hypothetical protein DN0286_38570 [Parabacteroides distasonis]